MNLPHCPMCPTGHFRFSTKDGVLTETCDVRACNFSRRVTPVSRPNAYKGGMVTAVCQVVGCGAEFEYERGPTAKRLKRYCDPCRKKAYHPCGANLRGTKFGTSGRFRPRKAA